MEEGEMSAAAEKEEEMSGDAGKEEKEKPDGEQDVKKTLSLPTISDMSSPWRWRVSYSTKLLERRTATYEGSILLQPEVNRIVLLDTDEMAAIDARYLKEGELIYPGSVLHPLATRPSRSKTPTTDLDDEDCQVTPNVVQTTHKGAGKMPMEVRSPVERRDRVATTRGEI